MTKERLSLGLLSAVFMMPVVIAAPLPRLQDHLYDEARAKMIKLGYRPVRFLRTEDGCLLDTTCKRYPELLNCSLKSRDNCKFAFSKADGNEYVVVTTRGTPRRVYSIRTPSRRERSQWPMMTPHKPQNRSGHRQ